MQYMEPFILWYTADVVRFRPYSFLPLCLAGVLLSETVFADQLHVTIGTEYDLNTIVQRIVVFLSVSITTVASAMFLVGAFMLVLSGAKEDYKQRGKDLMVGSLLSIAVVLGAYAIYRTIAFFLLT